MRGIIIKSFFHLFPLFAGLFWAGAVHAEIYVGAMGGINIPNDFSNVHSTGQFPNVPIPDGDLGTAPMAGAKLGFFLPSYDWVGFEFEGFYSAPEYTPWVDRGVDANLEVTTLGLNVLFRYPGERIQPYFGAGAGIFWAKIDSDLPGPSLTNNAVPGLNVVGGVRGFVTDSLALFLEYKFNYVQFNFRTRIFGLPFGFEGTYLANIIAAGLAWHFR